MPVVPIQPLAECAPEVAETHGRSAENKPMVVAEKPSCLKYRLKNGTMKAVQVNVNK